MDRFRIMFAQKSGQSIFELIVAIAISAVIIGSTTTAIIVAVRSSQVNVSSQKAYGIAREVLDNARGYAEANWPSFYNQDKGSATQYHLEVTATSTESYTLGIATGTNEVVVDSDSLDETLTYTTWFAIENVNRNADTAIAVSGRPDPSTQRITAYVQWEIGGETREIDLFTYVARTRNESTVFDDWSGSSGVAGPITRPDSSYYSVDADLTVTATSISFQ